LKPFQAPCDAPRESPLEAFVTRHTICAAAALCALTFVLAGCPATKSGSDAGSSTGADTGNGQPDGSTLTDGGVDAGVPGCGTGPACHPDEYCDTATLSCLPAKHCTADPSTDPSGERSCEFGQNDYCAYGACYCATEIAGGVCLPRVAPCATCTADRECGNTSDYIDYRAACVGIAGAAGVDSKVCVPKYEGACPPGYQQGTVSGTFQYCLPAGGSCGAPGPCASDADCDATSNSPICDTSQGVCIPACTYKYSDATSDCPPNQVCNVDPRLLQPPTNPNFGKGRCGVPCDTDGGYTCLAGTSCVPDGDAHTSSRPSRCRPPPPQCIRNNDCPADPGGHSFGYCNLATLSCSTGCQTNDNCAGGYHCVGGLCSQQTCLDEGGANIACQYGQFCCGETGGPPCPAGVMQGECYDSTNPPWCGDCTAGMSVATPGGGVRPQQSRCALDKMWHACDPSIPAECPRSEICTDGPMFCAQDADCGSGGQCVDIQAYGKMGKACSCQTGKTCPTPLSHCGMDAMGMPTVCLAKWCDMRACYPMMGM
jgi:hypothetical protein